MRLYVNSKEGVYKVDPVSQPEDPSLVWMACPWVLHHLSTAPEAGLYGI